MEAKTTPTSRHCTTDTTDTTRTLHFSATCTLQVAIDNPMQCDNVTPLHSLLSQGRRIAALLETRVLFCKHASSRRTPHHLCMLAGNICSCPSPSYPVEGVSRSFPSHACLTNARALLHALCFCTDKFIASFQVPARPPCYSRDQLSVINRMAGQNQPSRGIFERMIWNKIPIRATKVCDFTTAHATKTLSNRCFLGQRHRCSPHSEPFRTIVTIRFLW